MPFPSIQGSNAFLVDLSSGDVELKDILPDVYGGIASLYVSTSAGTPCQVDVVMADAAIGTEVSFVGVPSGTFLPIAVRAVADTTTADQVIAVVAKTGLR
jgi:hypothetical protein